MSNLSTLPKGDSAWLLRKAIERIMEQVSVLETNIGSSTTGNSANTQIIFNDNGTLRGDAGLVYNKTTDALTVTGLVTITGAATVGTTLGVTGVSTFAAGTALLPALTTTGDTNTGIFYPAADTFAVTTAGVERYRVDSAGQLGIGVTPSAWVSTFRAINVSTYAAFGGNSDDKLTLVANNFYNDGTGKFIGNGYASTYDQYQGAHRWQVSTTSNASGAGASATLTRLMTIDVNGNLLVGITSTNANGGVLQLKSGITFPATQVAASDANTLDDYEEGTWTPSIGGTATYTNQTGTYTKIGNRVYFSVRFVVLLAGTGEDFRISGLPFTSVGSQFAVSVGFFENLKTNAAFLSAYVNGSQICMTGTTVSTATITNLIGVIGNGTDLMISGFFTV